MKHITGRIAEFLILIFQSIGFILGVIILIGFNLAMFWFVIIAFNWMANVLRIYFPWIPGL